MSCELRTFAKIVELNKVRSFFFADGNEENWLQKCLLSYSPAKDILAMAYCNKMIVLESKWSNVPEDEIKITYHIVWQGIPDKCDREMIKSILCLPISTSTSRKRSQAQTTPDWTCIIVGFTSGYVRFYTEMGSLLLSQQLHDEPVADIMTQSSLLSQYYNGAEKNEDIHVLYKNVICSVIGFVLLNTLNACRNQLARIQANLGEVSILPTLTYKKWAFSSQGNVRGCAVAGSVPVNMFDHLFTASLCGGFNAKYQNNPPHSQLFVAVGSKPFVGFHYAFENEPQPILSELTKAVATKLKSAVPGWLLGGIKPNIRPMENRMEPAEEMGNRFGLTDDKRVGTSILMSPLGDVAAVTDNFGRISIIDMSYGIAVRMLKGYRDSHCGWILVEEEADSSSGVRRRVEFLVIYVPKKGLIEIWTMQFGAKVVTFSVDRDGKLLNSNFGIIGLYDGKNLHNSCTYIESSGEMKELNVPFYCCLSTKNNDRVRDIHMLKNMMKILKEENDQQEKLVQESVNLAQHLKTTDIIKQAVESLSSSKFISAGVLAAFLSALKDRLSSEADLLDDEDFLENMECLEHLTKLFQFLFDMYQLPPDYCSVDDSEFLNQEVCDILRIKESELDKLMTLLPTSRNKQKKVTFTSENLSSRSRTFYLFLSCFEKETTIKLQQNIPNKKTLDKISDLVCNGVMYGKCDFEDWAKTCEECGINEADLLFLVFYYWLHKPLSITLVREMLNLYKIVCAVLPSYTCQESNIDWQKIRFQLANSDCPLTAITAAIVCRAVGADIHNRQMKRQNEDEGVPEKDDMQVDVQADAGWETVTQEDCDWNILVSQLEDITFLDSALKYQPSSLPATLYCVPYVPPNVVLSSILKHGKGAISEFVAKWLVGMGLDPEFLLQNDVNVISNEKLSPKKSLLGVHEGIAPTLDPSFEARPMKPNEKDVLDLLEKLIAIFPYSLSSNVLLVNMVWEYVTAWKKNVNDMRPLEAAITTLQLIRCPHIKHGCCFLTWSIHLSMICEYASRLVNKVGKLPKDRLCKQETGIAEENFTHFLKLWTKFIDIFIETGFDMEVMPKPIFKYEPLWESNTFSPKNTVPPMTELAAKQKPSNQDLLYLLSQSARTLYFLTSFPIRITHPLESLFPSSITEMLFVNLQSDEAFYHPNPDEKIIVNRCSFLKKLITAIINEILKPYVEPNDAQASKSVDKLKPYVDWMSKVFKLAHDWSVPVDSLRRHQICELYTHGYDRLGEEMISSVNEKQQLGHLLLTILGLRMKMLLNSNVSYYSCFSPTVTTWIETLGDRVTVATVPVSDSLQLALAINHLTLESGKDENLVNLLLDSLTAINSHDKH